METLASADTNRIFRIIKPEEIQEQILKNVSEFAKTVQPGKIHYLFKTNDYCGKF